jgi:tRNA(adenine34) deaminase
MNKDKYFIKAALEEALLAYEEDEVPVGAVITMNENLVARAHNRTISENDPSAHAEILAIRKAAEQIGNYRLCETTLYVTIEPCLMCAGAIIQARIPRVVFGACDVKSGAVVSLYNVLKDGRLNHSAEVTGGVLGDECGEILSRFFREKRVRRLCM